MRQKTQKKNVAFVVFAAMSLMLVGLAASSGEAANKSDEWTKDRVGGSVVAPPGPNPYLANTPNGNADYRAWQAYATHASAERRAEQPRGPRSNAVNERPGRNDKPNAAQRVFLDTDNAEGRGGIDIIGSGAGAGAGILTDAGFANELNGSIPDAQLLPVLSVGDEVVGSGMIGDEDGDLFDFDFFELSDLEAGVSIVIDIDTPEPFGDLDSFVALWGSDGAIIDFNDDGDGSSFDSLLRVTIPADGTYYVSVGGFGAFYPADPFDSASSSITGAVGSQGVYSYSISASTSDVDFYKFDLDQGDIFGATAFGDAGRLELFSPSGELLIGSSQDLTFIHPANSPLPGGGNASLSYVIDTAGRYTMSVATAGDYVAELRAFRPTGDVPGRDSQVIFVDFDGGTVDTTIFGAPFGVRTLSPLSAFLTNWGLQATDEDAVVDAIMAVVEENLRSDPDLFGGNDDFDIVLLNSRDHAEPTGPLASRIIVGGTIPEFGIGTVGLAQSIDVGNFETSETAVVLLDLLSAPNGTPNFIPELSLNSYPIATGSDIIDLIGVGVGNITAHEAGHFFANWHTDQLNPDANIMDQGGNFAGTFGIGPDGVFGSDDDVDVDFGADVYVPNEGFIGVENTLTSLSFGLWSTGG